MLLEHLKVFEEKLSSLVTLGYKASECTGMDDSAISETVRANLPVELAGLSRSEQLMVKTVSKVDAVEEYAKVLTRYHSVARHSERLRDESSSPSATIEELVCVTRQSLGKVLSSFSHPTSIDLRVPGKFSYVSSEHDASTWWDDNGAYGDG